MRMTAPAPARDRVACTTACCLAAALLLAAPATHAVSPTRTAIAIDGDLSDWALVLANPANTTRDGDGSTIPCSASTDLDCPIADPSADITRFGWTWDD